MEGNQWTAPIWPVCAPHKEGKRRDFHFSYPDWGNIGPAFVTQAQYTGNYQYIGAGQWLCYLSSKIPFLYTKLNPSSYPSIAFFVATS